jgi:6-pyruvoyltetrahydropterin/6-carboxytetrahydropterin synthase
MRTRVTRLYRFSASHRLHVSQFSEEENASLYGKCNNPFGHGHNYVLEVTAEGTIDENTGLVLQGSELDKLVQARVLNVFEHRNINVDVPEFRELVPTTENIAAIIADLLRRNWNRFVSGGSRLCRVHVQETDRNGFEVRIPSDAAAPDKQSERMKAVV